MLSIAIPARNEEDSLEPLHREIDSVLEAASLQAEIIFVDDGSTDGTWSRIVALAGMDARVRGIRFRRNFGKAAALNAAFASVRGDVVITLDADLQDDPASIPRLIQKLEEGFDLVSAWRRERFDPWHKRIPSLLFNWLVGIFSGLKLHDHNCGLKCYRSEVVKEIRLFGDEYLTLKWAQTLDDDVVERNVLDAGTFFAQFERRRQEGFSYSTRYRRVGADYQPRLGFQLRNEFTLFGGSAGYSWFMGADSQLRAVTLSAETEHYYRNSDLSPESRVIAPQLMAGLKAGAFMILTSRSSFESIRTPFEIAGLTIDPGEYWFHEAEVSVRLGRGGLVRGELGGSAGSFYDGRRVSLRMSPALNISRHVEIRPGYDINRFELPGREYLTTHLARLNLDFSLDTHLSLSTLAQYNSTIDRLSVNARFRYHFREGVDLWVVYNEGYFMGRTNGRDPVRPWSAGRALMVKFSHTFAF